MTDPPSAPLPRPHWSDQLLLFADRYRYALLGGMALTYALAFNGQWRIEPDSALYLSIARNLATGHGYTYHGRPNAIGYPGVPYLLSLTMRLMPRYHQRQPLHLFLENLVLLGCALVTLALAYRLIRRATDRPTAVIVTFGLGLTRTFFRSSLSIMTDVPFMMGVMAVLSGYEELVRPWQPATGLQAGGSADPVPGRPDLAPWQRAVDIALMVAGAFITVVSRPVWMVFLPVVAISLLVALLQRRIRLRWAAVALSALVLAIVIFILMDPRKAAGTFRVDRYEDQLRNTLVRQSWLELLQHARANGLEMLRELIASAMLGLKFVSLPDTLTTWRWYTYVGAWTNAIFGLVVLAAGLRLFRRRLIWGLWISATVLMMLLVEPLERYFLPIMPLLVLAWWLALRRVNHALPPKWGNVIFAALLTLGMFPNLMHVVELIIEQRQPDFYHHYKDGDYVPLIRAANDIRTATIPNRVPILAPDKTARIESYLSRHTVVESNELLLDVGWPQEQCYVLYDPKDVIFRQWLWTLGIRYLRPVLARGAQKLSRRT